MTYHLDRPLPVLLAFGVLASAAMALCLSCAGCFRG